MFVMHVWLFLLKMRNINIKCLLLLLLFICTPFVLFFLAVSRTTGSTTVVTSPFTTPKMTRPSTDHPVVHVQLENGRFSVKLGRQNPFGRILVDQIIEKTINKDTKTPEGSKGFSLKPTALSRYYLTVEYRSTCLKQPGIDRYQAAWLQPPRLKIISYHKEWTGCTVAGLFDGNWMD